MHMKTSRKISIKALATIFLSFYCFLSLSFSVLWLFLLFFNFLFSFFRPPLWSSGQSSWLQIQRSRVQFSALPDFLRSSGSGTGSTQPHEYNRGVTWKKKNSGSCLESRKYGRRNPSCWPRGTLYPQNLAQTSPTSGGRSVGIVRSRTHDTEFS
jgi:hypothetical protein